ncbi:hypothetical protein IFM89_014237 [Coptis chinensis]|uniref:Small ribosomal subunit protein mS23 n=1 Tax=Coptis chinensis TaxID=261450 RepID=A0A835LHW6_9MAGN|nr:hypothetical protein IFM89_014237 [Coptis chinensis]
MELGDDFSRIRLRKLNLNAPILSTRRAGGSNCLKSIDADQEVCSQRIPFSWEQVPGTPKGTVNREVSAGEFRPPKLPPCQWHSTKGVQGSSNDNYKSNGEDEDDVFSDAIDMFSMSESLSVADSASNSRGLSSINLKIMESREHQSPDFIIRRFLPDANALASSYAPNRCLREPTTTSMFHMQKGPQTVAPNRCLRAPNTTSQFHMQRVAPNRCFREPITTSQFLMQKGPQTVDQAYSPHKACGIGLLFPRRVKHTVCGLKDPIRQDSQIAKQNYNLRQTQGASVEVLCKGGGQSERGLRMSFMRGDLLTKTRKLVKGLAIARPTWLKPMEQNPPAALPRTNGKVKRVALPEDVYVKKFFQKHPDSLYHDAIKISGFDPPPARIFAWKVLELKEQGVSEDKAMAVADMEYGAEKKSKLQAYKRLKEIARLEGKKPPPNPYPSAIKEIQAIERKYVHERFHSHRAHDIVREMKRQRDEERERWESYQD